MKACYIICVYGSSAQSRQNLRCSLIQAVSQEEPSDRKPDPWSLWMAGHAQLKFVMTECSKTQIRLTRLTCLLYNEENWSTDHVLLCRTLWIASMYDPHGQDNLFNTFRWARINSLFNTLTWARINSLFNTLTWARINSLIFLKDLDILVSSSGNQLLFFFVLFTHGTDNGSLTSAPK